MTQGCNNIRKATRPVHALNIGLTVLLTVAWAELIVAVVIALIAIFR